MRGLERRTIEVGNLGPVPSDLDATGLVLSFARGILAAHPRTDHTDS